jgi:hypothetical protein
MSCLKKDEEHKQKTRRERLLRNLGDCMFSLDVDKNERLSRDELEHAGNNDAFKELLLEMPLPYDFTFGELFLCLT